ncbi:MAG TPA: response regulator [Verrucomicrobiae bacterium]|jgi:CheY-like chemotaxis protein|nr:response regulator [Verrucomicrobiae bacterium]
MNPTAASIPTATDSTEMKKILVADDNEGLLRLIFRILTGEGFAVSIAVNGEDAWQKLRHESFDLLLTDNEMPHLGGLGLIERIRKEGMQLPVVLASGSLSAEATRQYRENPQLQISAVISKPLNIWDLLKTVRTAIEGTPVTHSAAETSQSGQPLTHNHVLIADDDAVVRSSLAAVLESEGYIVDEASNGNEAVTRAVRHKPDLVLLDLNMPHADGWTAFNQLDRLTPFLPIIIITARPNQYQKAVQLGVDAFMEKPLNIPILMRAVKRLAGEDENRHVKRVTNPAFVTHLLDSTYS